MDGIGIAATAVGAIFIYGGIKGYSPLKAFGNVLTGQNPNANQSASLLTNNNPSSSSPDYTITSGDTSASGNKKLAQQLAIQMGHADWTTGQMWSDWVALWNQESGWRIDAANPTSNARGIAQDINGFGPDNLQGNATSQITWGINYIAGRYGNPSVAEAHERANNWY